jgi:hypothetical protein
MAGEVKELVFSEGVTVTAPTQADFFLTSHVTKTGNYTATASDYIIFADGNSTTVTITLPAAASNDGKAYIIKATDITNQVDVDGNASETIDGSLTYIFTTTNEFIFIVSDGTNWRIIG